jgi:hypothetical protein
MIWELQITSIVCVANDTEAGRVKIHEPFQGGMHRFCVLFSLNFVVIGPMKVQQFNLIPIVSARQVLMC